MYSCRENSQCAKDEPSLRKVSHIVPFCVKSILISVHVFSDKAEFRRSKVKLTCPGKANWFYKNEKVYNGSDIYEFTYTSKGQYRCEYETNQKYYFYVEGNGEWKRIFFLSCLVLAVHAALTLDVFYLQCVRTALSSMETYYLWSSSGTYSWQ